MPAIAVTLTLQDVALLDNGLGTVNDFSVHELSYIRTIKKEKSQ